MKVGAGYPQVPEFVPLNERDLTGVMAPAAPEGTPPAADQG